MASFHMNDLFGVRRIGMSEQGVHQHEYGNSKERKDRKHFTLHGNPSMCVIGLVIADSTGIIMP
jgi:hypothetical protein